MGLCVVCGKALVNRQRKFCSRNCKNRETNNIHQSYRAQQQRGRERKLRFVRQKRGQGERCGHSSNHAAWNFTTMTLRQSTSRSTSDRYQTAACPTC